MDLFFCRSFGVCEQDFEARVADFSSSMGVLRSAEIAFREGFRRTHLGNLPPVFLEVSVRFLFCFFLVSFFVAFSNVLSCVSFLLFLFSV